MKKRLISFLFIIVFTIGCSNKEEIDKLKKENEKLKETTTQLVEEIKTIKENKKKEFSSKVGTMKVLIEVENYKPNGRKWDSMSAPDISGKITFPDEKVLFIRKHQDSYSAKGLIRNVKLKKGDKIKIFLEDIDVSRNDNIAVGSITYNGEKSFSKKIGSAYITFVFE